MAQTQEEKLVYNILSKYAKKPADKITPKFKVGDWITDGHLTCKVLSVTGKFYELHLYNDDYCHFETDVQSVDKRYHLWTIEDAKDGDVLVDSYSKDSLIILYKGINKEQSILAHCGWNGYNFSIKTNGLGYGGLDNTNYLPATKEQRDLLFQKMKEAGYEWDSEKKELNKIEQKTVDKTEPKFKVRDWILNDVCFPLQIASIRDGMYVFTEGDAISVSFVDEHLHLWTIQDAMDGDVLVAKDDRPFIFTGEFDVQDDNPTAYCGINSSDKFITGMGSHWTFKDGIKPATKEQQDLLFAKMKEAGYEWDAEKKELKKIEVVSKESEDERIRKTLIEYIKGIKSWNYFLGISKGQMIAWLEKQGEPKDKEELAKGLLIQVATSIMNWLDANTTKGEKCLSNMECEDIETAVRNADWNKVYAYMKKKLEKSALSYRDIDKKVDELVDEFSHTEIGGYGRPGPIEIDAYRKGMNDAIRSIYEYNKIQI